MTISIRIKVLVLQNVEKEATLLISMYTKKFVLIQQSSKAFMHVRTQKFLLFSISYSNALATEEKSFVDF